MTKSLPLLFIALLLGLNLFAGADVKDTLILNDGKTVTGTISKKSLEAFNDMRADLNSSSTIVEEGDGNTVKIPNNTVNYFVIKGVRYANRIMGGTHKFLKVIVEGKASVYEWSGSVMFGYERTSAPSNGWVTKTTTYSNTDLGTHTYLFLNDKNYSANAKYIKKNFQTIFAGCQKLITDAQRDSKFDYADLATIALKYNDCFTGGGH